MKVAVYGSLKQGFHNHSVMRQAGGQYEKSVRISGYDLYSLGSFPAIVEGEGSVECEVYAVEDIQPLDWLEGYREESEEDSFYLRRSVSVDGEDVFLYVFNGDVAGLERVEDGVW